ncbi:MAG: biopolymer transporter ExbD [Alphaproteobacteria bacterium]|nr:biopolymer transporter ExbD [Alphaproteobacteria bacterium]MCB9698426.1 biopolymer transporter ExbD [Alphaproteobacteria bacterium]
MLWVAAAWAQEPDAIELVGQVAGPRDATLYVRQDGAWTFEDVLLDPADLEEHLREDLAATPDLRIVVRSDPRAPYQAVTRAVEIARSAGAVHVALEAPNLVAKQVDPLFPGASDVTVLDEPLDASTERHLAPKHHHFPQNPYGNTTSYSAYTLEWGETKIGIGSITTGVLPGLQVGTAPLLDVVGVFNVSGKLNLGRRGPLDAGVLGHFYTVPLTGVVSALAEDFDGTASASYFAAGATASLRVASPVTVHGQLYWARPSAQGEIHFDELPLELFPSDLTLTADVGIGVNADLLITNLATDVRFNRRDSVFVWARYPFYGVVRGRTEASIPGISGGTSFGTLGYETFIPPQDSLSVAGGYMASWKHVELRVGIGWTSTGGTPEVPTTITGGGTDPVIDEPAFNPASLAWLLQAFELSYKFGGPTRRAERDIQKAYREVQDLEEHHEGDPVP